MLTLTLLATPPWMQGLDQRFVGVLQHRVLADDGDGHLAVRVAERRRAICLPARQVRLGRVASCRNDVQHLGVQTLAVIVQRHGVDVGGIHRLDDARWAARCRTGRSCASRPRGIGSSQRHSRMSGWMPIERSSLTECCVGLVFISPAVLMKGSSVRWTKQAWPRGSSWPSWRIASKNGRPSMSPTVPPISTRTKSTSSPSSSGRRQDEVLDLVGDVRNHLDGRAEIVAAPLLLDDRRVDLAGGDVVGPGRVDAR